MNELEKNCLNKRFLLAGLILTETISEVFTKDVHLLVWKQLTYPRNNKIMRAVMLLFGINDSTQWHVSEHK